MTRKSNADVTIFSEPILIFKLDLCKNLRKSWEFSLYDPAGDFKTSVVLLDLQQDVSDMRGDAEPARSGDTELRSVDRGRGHSTNTVNSRGILLYLK